MTGIELKEIVIDQHKERKSGRIVERDIMSGYKDFHKNPFIVIISGVRRCGKSTLLKQIMLKNSGFYLNFDDDRLVNFSVDDFQKLTEVFQELYGERQYYYLDEIQNIQGWELFARRLRDEGKKLYVTGSNATMLSKELGTRLTGRYLQITLFPFSFREFCKFKNVPVYKSGNFTTEEKSRLKANFNQYITLGGFPEYLLTENVEYLRTLYNNIIYRDVMARYNITSDKSVKELMYQIASNTAKEFSYNSLKNILQLGSSTTIKDYIGYMENSYLLVQVPKFSFSVKSQIYANKKIFMIDTAMALLNGFRSSGDKGRLLENLVCLQLKKNNFELFYFRNKFECDFIVRKNDLYQAVQVCYEINDNNRTREINGLVEAMDTLNLKKGKIITIDQEEVLVQDNKQINLVPAYKWFLNV